MVLPKSTVHVSRLAGTALKSFTHGYAQTVVAASQSSYASQNTPVAPLASNLLSRFKDKSGKPDQHVRFSTNAAGQQASEASSVKQDIAQDAGLAQYQEAWQKHNKAESREWHHLPLAKRIGWKPPTTIPEPQRTPSHVTAKEIDSAAASGVEEGSSLRRSYSTSAVDNFAKAIDNEEAEALAIKQVNQSITGELGRSKDLSDQQSGLELALPTKTIRSESTDAVSSSSKAEAYTAKLQQLASDRQYAQIPAVFESMLQDGVAAPSQAAYRALLTSAVELTDNRHQKVPRVLDIFSDMVRRAATPDTETLGVIVDTLAIRALDAARTSIAIHQKLQRYGAMSSVFTLDDLEFKIMSEDQALSIALRFIDTAPAEFQLPNSTMAILIQACAVRDQVPEMMRLYSLSKSQSSTLPSSIYPAMIEAFGKAGDLRSAVASFDDYRDMAIANNSGENSIQRIDREVHSALVSAYGTCGNLEGGKKLLARVDVDERNADVKHRSRDAILTAAVLPLELQKQNFDDVYAIVNSLSSRFYASALETIAKVTADNSNIIESGKAFDALASVNANLAPAAIALMSFHIRTQDVEGAERYWRVLEQSPVNLEIVELGVLRALSYISLGQVMRGLRPVRTTLGKYRHLATSSDISAREAADRLEEAVEVIARAVISGGPTTSSPEISAELLRIMNDSGSMIVPFAENMVAALSAEQIAMMAPSDLEMFTQTQAHLIVEGGRQDVAAPARFACMLENLVGRTIMPDVNTENAIEKALVDLDRADLNQLWSSYRYPSTPAYSPSVSNPTASVFSAFSPQSSATPQSTFDESFDPYISQTDHKGSVVITDILEKTNGRPASILSEALTKFRNIRRAGRHPRFFAYGKLIQAAAKANQLETAREVLEMAKQDVPYLPQYRIVRHGWVAILDSMVSACITAGRRELAARYHQDLLDLGAAPSANTFGLYITSLKETTKTFDEASEAVKIFLRSKAEGVEPTSFLYNALIGKLGKARRIDDCLFYFAEMRNLGIRPTSVTYGTIVNALCRVSDEKFAEEIFEEMETSTNYKPRPAPYHSLMQFFLTTKRDRSKVLAYYERMRQQNIAPTMHTFKLLIDAHATIEPIDMPAAEAVLEQMKQAGVQPEAVHYASLIHAKGCVLHDIDGASALFDKVVGDRSVRLQACIYQALFESLVANRKVADSDALLSDMFSRRVELTPYIVNALIHGWTLEKNLAKAQEAFSMVDIYHREPSTYEAMVRAHLAVEDRAGAEAVVTEALSRGYPSAVAGKIAELVGGGRS